MSGNKKGIIIILIIVAGIIVILARGVPRSKTSEVASNTVKQPISHAQQVAEYQQNIKSIAANYQNIIDAVKANSTSTASSSQIAALEEIKNKLTNNNITVPPEFMNMHIDLFFSILNLENYFKNNQLSAKASSSNLWQSLQKDYNWITK